MDPLTGHLKFLNHKKNQGAAHCLNLGVKHANGSWIAIQDADDLRNI
ncbi:glycosyltransferase [Fictibacillus sp. NPDC058756]